VSVQIGDNGLLIASSGCLSDTRELVQTLNYDTRMYEFENDRHLSVSAFASMLANQLYRRRNFPYLSFCLSGGLSKSGTRHHANRFRYVTTLYIDVSRRWANISL
jgi:20S proteasome alpha/beta subunit